MDPAGHGHQRLALDAPRTWSPPVADPADRAASPTPDRPARLRERASRLTEAIIPYEEPCEAARELPEQSLAAIRELVLEYRLHAINMPAEWGGQGLSLLEQVVVQERLGRLTNALWDVVWRPANAMKACTPSSASAGCCPASTARGAMPSPSPRSPPAATRWRCDDRPTRRRRLGDRRRQVVRDRRRRRRLLAWCSRSPVRRGSDDVPRRQGHAGRAGQANATLHAHVRLRASRVRLRPTCVLARTTYSAESAMDTS